MGEKKTDFRVVGKYHSILVFKVYMHFLRKEKSGSLNARMFILVTFGYETSNNRKLISSQLWFYLFIFSFRKLLLNYSCDSSLPPSPFVFFRMIMYYLYYEDLVSRFSKEITV